MTNVAAGDAGDPDAGNILVDFLLWQLKISACTCFS